MAIIVTEHDVADLRGLSPVERADKLISKCADPEYRERLRAYLNHAIEQPGHLPHDLTAADSWLG